MAGVAEAQRAGVPLGVTTPEDIIHVGKCVLYLNEIFVSRLLRCGVALGSVDPPWRWHYVVHGQHPLLLHSILTRVQGPATPSAKLPKKTCRERSKLTGKIKLCSYKRPPFISSNASDASNPINISSGKKWLKERN